MTRIAELEARIVALEAQLAAERAAHAETKRERGQLLDKLHCMCGSPIDHSAWEGHTPVSVYDYSLDQERSRAEAAEAKLAVSAKETRMTDDWRDIPMREINWRHVRSHIGLSAHKFRRLSQPPFDNRPPQPYRNGSWCDLTLGQVADMGSREILRHEGIGKVALAGLQYVIDLAASGNMATNRDPAPDALRPTTEEVR